MTQTVVEPAQQADALAAPRAIWEDAKRRSLRVSKVKNLELLWSILMEIRANGGRDYSLAQVGRRMEEKGGLKTQSLRNAGGADFQEIITSFAQSVFGSSRCIAKTKSTVDQALDFIADISVRAVLKEEIAQAKKLREENAMLRNAFSRLSIPSSVCQPGHPEETKPILCLAEAPKVEVVRPVPLTGVLQEKHLMALAKGCDRQRIRKLGFKPMEDGSITNARGDELFPQGFLIACDSVLALHSEEGG